MNHYVIFVFPLLIYLLPYLLTYLLTPWCRVLLEKLTGLQLVKKFPAFHETRRFITALTSIRHLSILGQPNPVHIPTSHLLEIHPNIIHPSTPRSPQWSPSLRFVFPLLCVFITSSTRVGFVSCACHSPHADNPSSSDSFVCHLPINFSVLIL